VCPEGTWCCELSQVKGMRASLLDSIVQVEGGGTEASPEASDPPAREYPAIHIFIDLFGHHHGRR
jgi:hypothetical protein